MSIQNTLAEIDELSGEALAQWYANRFDPLDIDGNDLKSLAAYTRKLEAAVIDARNYLDYAKAATNVSFAIQQAELAQTKLRQALKEGE